MQTLKFLAITSLITLIASCGSIATKPERESVVLTLESLPGYLAEENKISATERSHRELNAVEFLIGKKETDWAHTLLNQLSLPANDDNFFLRYMLAQGRLAILEGEPYLAQRYLFDERITTQMLSANPEPGSALLDVSATLQYDLANYLRAFELRITLSKLLKNEEEAIKQLNHDLIWEALAEIPSSELYTHSESKNSPLEKGWLSLAALSKSNGANYRKQIKDIQLWRTDWPKHPANALLPADLQLILQLSDQQAINIAVLLPLSGKLASAGQAVLDGFLAAYYDDAASAPILPSLQFHDTTSADINTLYDRALANGAQLVVGPLLKQDVTALAIRKHLPTPVLALNSIDNESVSNTTETEAENLSDPSADAEKPELETPPLHNALYQFTLAVESEAEHVASRAWKDGHRRVLIIAPASTWGDRSVSTFRDSWEKFGGKVIDERRFKDQRSYSALIESSVAVDRSKQRSRQLQQLLGKTLEFEPRSRRDIDFIYMPSYSHQARQLKPLLAFHYAGDIPVYSMSQVYDGESDKNLNDLNGIKFSTLPWFFNENAHENSAIKAHTENTSALQHFYAMGVDAYHIYPRLEQLKKIKQAQFYGQTGKLSITEGNLIFREQTWAEIRNGKAIEIKSHLALEDMD